MKYAFIRQHRRMWPIRMQCQVLGVSVAGYHEHLLRRRRPQPRRHLSDEALLVHIRAIYAVNFAERPVYRAVRSKQKGFLLFEDGFSQHYRYGS